MPVAREREASVVAELAGDVDDAAALVQQEAGEAVAQCVRRGGWSAGDGARAVEGASSPRLVRGLGPRLASLAGEHECVIGRPTTRQAPRRKIGLQRGE